MADYEIFILWSIPLQLTKRIVYGQVLMLGVKVAFRIDRSAFNSPLDETQSLVELEVEGTVFDRGLMEPSEAFSQQFHYTKRSVAKCGVRRVHTGNGASHQPVNLTVVVSRELQYLGHGEVGMCPSHARYFIHQQLGVGGFGEFEKTNLTPWMSQTISRNLRSVLICELPVPGRVRVAEYGRYGRLLPQDVHLHVGQTRAPRGSVERAGPRFRQPPLARLPLRRGPSLLPTAVSPLPPRRRLL